MELVEEEKDKSPIISRTARKRKRHKFLLNVTKKKKEKTKDLTEETYECPECKETDYAHNFLICDECEINSEHIGCIDPALPLDFDMINDKWYCDPTNNWASCKSKKIKEGEEYQCKECNRVDIAHNFIMCSECRKIKHLDCLKPPLSSDFNIEVTKWFCDPTNNWISCKSKKNKEGEKYQCKECIPSEEINLGLESKEIKEIEA